ncbi:TPA: hypothetical protein G8N70_003648 [Salmonella enterica]|uniref:Uncharacterized protein n=1 Tax=Salmonella enterica TaxID=28901 RepID=A0A744CDC4_SALER|nr:hypothetical protein [Salmonella enterica]HAF4921894.1 hypothetical protein [Salmonella enterica]
MLFLFQVFSRGAITIIANLGKRGGCADFHVPLPNHNVQPIRLSYYLRPHYVLNDIDMLAVLNEPEFMFSCAIIDRLEVCSTIQGITVRKWRGKITGADIMRWLCGEVFSSWDMSPISMIGNVGKERNND